MIFSWSVLIFMCVIIVIQSKHQYKVLFVIFGSWTTNWKGRRGGRGGGGGGGGCVSEFKSPVMWYIIQPWKSKLPNEVGNVLISIILVYFSVSTSLFHCSARWGREREVGVGITNLIWRFFPSFSVPTCTFLTVFFLITQIKGLGAKAGVVLNPGTPLTAIEYVLDGEFISRSLFSFIIYLFLCNMLIRKAFNDVTEGPYLIWPICWGSFLISICYLLTTKLRCGHMPSLPMGYWTSQEPLIKNAE